jgi:hypothetical protein
MSEDRCTADKERNPWAASGGAGASQRAEKRCGNVALGDINQSCRNGILPSERTVEIGRSEVAASYSAEIDPARSGGDIACRSRPHEIGDHEDGQHLQRRSRFRFNLSRIGTPKKSQAS